MDKIQLGEFVKSFVPEAEVKDGRHYTEITVPASKLFSTAKLLRESEETLFDYLICISGVDYGQELGAVYHMNSTRHGHMLVLKSRTGRDNPNLDSVCSIWKSADLLEREIYDLLGIKFNNHPDLRRLFLDSSWGFPLRKDYKDDINIVSK
jgi:NADH-quinone oxidoreductase subunit C